MGAIMNNETSIITQRRLLARKSDDPNYRKQREELIAAAARVFRRKGFQAAKLQDIAEEVGKNRITLYYYTSGKDELFQEIVAEVVLGNVEMVEKLYAQELPSTSKLRYLCTRLMASYEAHYPYLFVYIQEPMTQLDDSTEWGLMMKSLQGRFDEATKGIIRQGIEDGSFRISSNHITMIANAILGMLHWSHRWFQLEKGMSGESIGLIFADLVLNGLATSRSD